MTKILRFKDQPIRNKLIIIMMTASIFGLAITGSMAVYHEYTYTKNEITDRLTTLAKIIGDRSIAALLFEDKRVALENLSSLKKDSTIEHATIFLNDKTVFANYVIEKHIHEEENIEDIHHDSRYITVTESIVNDGEVIGLIALSSNLDMLRQRQRDQLITGSWIGLFLVVFTFIISSWLQKFISRPILELTDTANDIKNKRNYSKRALKYSNDELGTLVDAFNEMLDNLAEAREKLKDVNLSLEEKVNEKTRELQEFNKTLESRIKEEIQKNSEKDKLIFEQSKMAAMGEMINNIAHQWRQPINAINLVMGNLKDAYDFGRLDEKMISKSTLKVDRLVNKMSTTIDDFRNFFKQDKDVQEFDVNRTIDSTLSIVEDTIKSHGIEILKEMQNGIYIEGFPSEFSQVILNIVNNAKDALIEKSIRDAKIFIRTYKKDSYAYIEVQDNAGGIPSDIINRIFEPYFTTKHQTHGTGIGLYMSKIIIVDHMKGFISVGNQNGGALFVIMMKLKEEKI